MVKLDCFKKENIGDVRVYGDANNPLFCLIDICKILGFPKTYSMHQKLIEEFKSEKEVEDSYSNTKNSDGLPYLADNKVTYMIQTNTTKGLRELIYIKESHLYFLIFKSTKKIAKQFRLWMFEEVIPSIRSNGGYLKDQSNLSDEEILAKSLILANNILKKREEELKLKNAENAKLQSVIVENQPKVETYNHLMELNENMTIRDYARLTKHFHNLKEQDFFNFLMKKNLIFRSKTANQKLHATPKALNKRVMTTKEFVYETKYGRRTATQPVITPAGQEYILNLIRKDILKESINVD